MMSMKIILCHLVMQFKFHTDMKFDELILSHVSLLKLVNRYAVTVEQR